MNDFIDFFNTIEKLKRVKRTGWVREGVPDPESVADHSFGTTMLCYALADELNVDKGKLVKMALLHDLAEVKTGDIVARRGATVLHDKKDKYEKEKKAFESLFLKVDCGREALKLWMEFEEQKTREAQLLKQIDKLEMTFQAFDYGGDVDSSKLDEFWNDTRTALKEPFLIKIFNELEKRRKK